MNSLIKYYRLPILAGLLTVTSFIPFPPWALLFASTPLFVFWWREKSLKRIFWAGWITQFIINLLCCHWMAYTVIEFGQMPVPVGILSLLLFSSVGLLHYSITGVLWKSLCAKARLSPTASFLTLPLIFGLCQIFWPCLFPYSLGYSWLWGNLPGYHLAQWVGFFGLHIMTLSLQSLLAAFWLYRKPRSWTHPYLWSTLALFLILQFLGWLQSQNLPSADRELNVALIQGNIGNLDKIYAIKKHNYTQGVVQTYINLTNQTLTQGIKQDKTEKKLPLVDLIIWPETAFPERIYTPETYKGTHRKQLSRWIKTHEIPLLTGAYETALETGTTYNSALLIQGDKVQDGYRKTHLLAFGEYFPFPRPFPS